MEPYLHFPIRLHGVVLGRAQLAVSYNRGTTLASDDLSFSACFGLLDHQRVGTLLCCIGNPMQTGVATHISEVKLN